MFLKNYDSVFLVKIWSHNAEELVEFSLRIHYLRKSLVQTILVLAFARNCRSVPFNKPFCSIPYALRSIPYAVPKFFDSIRHIRYFVVFGTISKSLMKVKHQFFRYLWVLFLFPA